MQLLRVESVLPQPHEGKPPPHPHANTPPQPHEDRLPPQLHASTPPNAVGMIIPPRPREDFLPPTSTDLGTGRPSLQEDSMDYRKLPTGVADECPTGASITRRPTNFLGRRAPPDPPEAYGRDPSHQRGEVPARPQGPALKGQAGRY